MPWLVKALLLGLKTKRGHELLFAGALGAVEIARSDRARRFYAIARGAAADPRPRKNAARVIRSVASRIRR